MSNPITNPAKRIVLLCEQLLHHSTDPLYRALLLATRTDVGSMDDMAQMVIAMNRLVAVHVQIDAIETFEADDDAPAEAYRPILVDLRNLFHPGAIGQAVNQAMGPYVQHRGKQVLSLIGHQWHRERSEHRIADEELSKLRSRWVDELKGLSALDIDNKLKDFLTQSLKRLIEAIDLYPIAGISPVEAATDSIWMEGMKNHDELQRTTDAMAPDAQARSTWQTFCSGLKTTMTWVGHAKTVVETGTKGIEFYERIRALLPGIQV